MTVTPVGPRSSQLGRARKGQDHGVLPGERSERGERGAASAEYAAVTAAGVGLAGVLIRILTSDFGQELLQMILEFFLRMIGIG